MSIKVREKFEKDPVMMREVLCNTLIGLAETDSRIVALDADLMSSSGMKPFAKKFPDRFINCGVQEANMMGVAAGLSAVGKVPFAHTFGPFASRRAYDQVFISCSYAKANVKIIGTDPGVTAAYNGGTHMPFEDMGILRCIPEITLIEPADSAQLASVLRQLPNLFGVHYIRLARKNPIAVFEDGSEFVIGRGALLRPGRDVTVFASGIMVAEALKAAATLANDGIDARIVNIFTWKPIDRELVAACAQETGAVVTAENHNIIGGLGSAVAEVLGDLCPRPLERVGVKDEFGEVGTEDYLRKRFRLTAEAVVEAAKKAVTRKAN